MDLKNTISNQPFPQETDIWWIIPAMQSVSSLILGAVLPRLMREPRRKNSK